MYDYQNPKENEEYLQGGRISFGIEKNNSRFSIARKQKLCQEILHPFFLKGSDENKITEHL